MCSRCHGFAIQIYTKEAHPSDAFPSPINERELVTVKDHDGLDVRCATAKFAKDHLDTQLAEQVPYAMLVDGMDNALEELFEAVPYRVAVADASTMKLFYISQLGPFNPAGKHMDAIAALVELYESKNAAADAAGAAVEQEPDVVAALAEALSTEVAATDTDAAAAADDDDSDAAAAAAAARTAARARYYAEDTPIDADSLVWMLAQTSANSGGGVAGSTEAK